MEKEDITYLIEFKHTMGSHIPDEAVKEILSRAEEEKLPEGLRHIFITPVSTVKKDFREQFNKKSIIVLDREDLEELFSGKDTLSKYKKQQ